MARRGADEGLPCAAIFVGAVPPAPRPDPSATVARVNDEAQSHSPFLRRIGLKNDRSDAIGEPRPEPEPAEEPGLAREGLRRALLEVGERVDEIIAGAERTAEDVRRRAQIDAERYLSEARRRAEALEAERNKRLQGTLEALRSGISRIEDETARTVRSVEETIRGSEELTGPPPVDEPLGAPQPPIAPAPAPVAYPGRPSRDPSEGAEAAEPRVSMLIRATQLAVQGHDRREIEQTLEREFGAADAALVVDQVLGQR
jgi:hypothetical protein